MLQAVVPGQLHERRDRARIQRLGPPPGIEVPFLPREREPARAGLEIDHERLELVRGRDHLLRAPRVQRALVQTDDRKKENGEHDRQPDRNSDRGEGDSCDEPRPRPRSSRLTVRFSRACKSFCVGAGF